MTIGLQEDRSIFLQANHFAVEGSVDGCPVLGIFDQPQVEGLGVSDRNPQFEIDEDSLADPVGKQITIKSVLYNIIDAQPDGTGFSILILERP